MKKSHPELQWLKSVYENCETVGISKSTVERFEKYYLTERRQQNGRMDSVSKRT